MTRPFRFCIGICIAITLLSVFVGPVSAALVPRITGFSPSGGPITGGTVVTITGAGFTGTKDVLFGENHATALNIVNDNQLTVTTPPAPAGTVALSVINTAGTGGSIGPSTMFQYEEIPLPRLAGISPSSGSGKGGTAVTLTGSGFTGTEYVLFGGKYGMDLKVVDDNQLTVMTPASSPGLVPISIKNAAGIGGAQEPSAMYLYEFSFPELTTILPSSGSTAGGTVVTITGSGFTGATDVRFGGIPGTGLNIVDDSSLTIISPPSPPGTVALSVINPAGAGGSGGAATVFRYEIPLPKVTGISPSSGSTDGGTLVTITGSGFNGTKYVVFGGKSGTDLTVVDDSHLRVMTPASSPGLVPISITSALGEGGSLGPSTMFRYEFIPSATMAMKTATTASGGDRAMASPTLAATPSPAASGTLTTPGFEAVAVLSALGAIILLRRTIP
jgi:hypothetical protein